MATEPEPATSLLHYLLAAATAIGTAVGAAFAAMKLRRHRPEQEPGAEAITKSDLLEMRMLIEGAAKSDRHEIYNRIHALGAGLEMDMQRLNGNIAEYVKSNETRLRALEDKHDTRIRQAEIAIARLGGSREP